VLCPQISAHRRGGTAPVCFVVRQLRKRGRMNYSIEDFKQVIENESSLTRMGVNSLHTIKSFNNSSLDEAKEKLKFERESFLSHYNEFKICCEWLSKFKKVNTPQFSSQVGWARHFVPTVSLPADISTPLKTSTS
jgi:hypothetical protein